MRDLPHNMWQKDHAPSKLATEVPIVTHKAGELAMHMAGILIPKGAKMQLKFLLLCGAVACGVLPTMAPAQAQVQVQGQEADLDKLDRMQRQMNQLQQQIQLLKGDIAQAKKKPDTAYAASPPPAAKLPPPPAAPTAVAKMTPLYRPSICAL